jgi:hypothetical protein
VSKSTMGISAEKIRRRPSFRTVVITPRWT